jgi:hypothetical protein
MIQTTAASIDAVTRVTVLFALVLSLSFVIERVLELLKAAFDMLDGRLDLHKKFWTNRTIRIQQYIEHRLRLFNYVDPQAAAGVLRRFDEMLLGVPEEEGKNTTVPILCGDMVRGVYVRATLKALGCAMGIAFAFGFGLDLLAISRMPAPGPGAATSMPPASVFGMLLTGVVVGLGSGIVHKVITAIERRQQRQSAQVEVANA